MAAFAVFILRCAAARPLLAAGVLAVGLSAVGLSGCTVWGAKQPRAFKNTTSAEQYERIFWSNAHARKWGQVASVLAPNVVYTVDDRVLTRDQIIPYLQSRKIYEFVIADMVVKPNGPDMTLSYSLQLEAPGGNPQSFTALSVWQQARGGWILIAHAEQPKPMPGPPN